MRKLIEGRPALVVIDMQKGGEMSADQSGIAGMPGFEGRVRRIRAIVDAARAAKIPVIFFQEAHRPDHVDFGRELDGAEGVHCVEGAPGTELVDALRPLPNEYFIRKRRYSGFFGTDCQILLRGLKVSERARS